MRRTCPQCWLKLEQEYRTGGTERIEIDICRRCKGIYLDDGELRTLTRNRSLAKWLIKHLELSSDSRLTCPGCGGVMDSKQPGNVEVEVCQACHGIWLDWSELDQLSKITKADLEELEHSEEQMDEMFKPPVNDKEHQGPLRVLKFLFQKKQKE